MNADAAKRAAAAEARRQKILARGAERLSRITVGTPIPAADSADSSALPERSAKAEQPTSSERNTHHASNQAETGATPPSPQEVGAAFHAHNDVAEAAGAEEMAVPAAVLASADPMLQEVLRGGSGRSEQDTAVLQAAQRNAEQALHTLLNQLAGSAGAAAYLTQQQQQQPTTTPVEQPTSRAAAGPASREASGAGGGGVGPSGRWTPGTGEGSSQAGTRIAAPEAAAGGRCRPPLVPSPQAGIPSPPPAAGGGGSGGGVLLALAAALAALMGVLLGPQLTAAVESTRRLRVVAAAALAAALYSGVVEPEHLRLPPVVALLLLQVVLIVAARSLGGPAGAGRRPSRGLSKSASGAALAGDGGADDDSAAAAATTAVAAVSPAAASCFDWAALVPGLRPLLDKLASARALVSGLFGDVAVFVVSYIVLDAWGQVSGVR